MLKSSQLSHGDFAHAQHNQPLINGKFSHFSRPANLDDAWVCQLDSAPQGSMHERMPEVVSKRKRKKVFNG